MRRIFFIISILAVSLLPIQVSAQLDQRCWEKADCVAARKSLNSQMTDVEAADGFYTGPDTTRICGTKVVGKEESALSGLLGTTVGNFLGGGSDIIEPLGFCLPAGQTNAQISFGGKTRFANIGDWIQFMYRYSIAIAGILATLVILISGIQWMMSGGNTATIGSAKKRIVGAIAGLIIAVGSYTILYTLNPNLVSLRLPQIFMINSRSVPTNYCSELPSGTRVATFRKWGAQEDLSTDAINTSYAQAKFNISAGGAECGSVYFISGEAGSVCHGNFCDPGHVCAHTDLTKPPSCERGALTGTIRTAGDFFENRQASEVIDQTMQLIAVCGDGSTERAGREIQARPTAEGQGQYYIFPSKPKDTCFNKKGTLGFYIAAEVNDRSGLIRTGNDDFFAIGKDPSKPHQCSTNLSQWALEQVGTKVDCTSDSDDENCSCEGIAELLDTTVGFKQIKEPLQKLLFTEKELDGSYECNIVLARKSFPDLDHESFLSECDE